MKNKLILWIKNNSSTFRFSMIMNAIFLILSLAMDRPIEVTDDDLIFKTFCNGVYGSYGCRFQIINIILGYILKLLYSFFPFVEWFDVVQYIILYFSFCVITFVIIRLFSGRVLSFVISSIINIFWQYEAYIRIQYTKTCGISTAAGFLLVIYASISSDLTRKKRTILLICGTVLALFGSFYRYRQFFSVLILMSGIILYIFLSCAFRTNEKKFADKWKIILAGSISFVILLSGLGVLIDNVEFQKNKEWGNYRDYVYLRSALFDYGFPDFSENKEALQSIGITESAYQLLQSYNYADPEVFTMDRMQKIIDLKESKHLSGTTVKEFAAQFPAAFFDVNVFYAVLLIFSIWILFGTHNRAAFISILYEIILFGAMYFYMFYKGRYLVARVDVGLLLGVLLTIVWVIPNSRTDVEHVDFKVSLLICTIVFIFCQANWKECWHCNMDKMAGITSGQQQKLKEISGDREHLYLCKQGYPNILFAYEPFDVMPRGEFHNIYWLGGWQTFAPITETPLGNYGITNPYKDAIGNEHVYFVDNNIDLTIAYIHDYYDPDATAQLVKTVGGDYNVYKILK